MNVVKDKWLSVSMQSDKIAKIKIHGVIGGDWFDEGVTDAQVEADLEGIKSLKADVIEVDLDSLGGSVKHGTKIYNLLKSNPAKINVNITGWTASMGTVIAMAGDSIEMVDNSYFLIHEARTMSWGVKSQLEADAKFLDAINDTMADIYAKRIGDTKENMLTLMATNGGEGEFWTAAETLKRGFVDSVYTPEKQSRAAAMLTDKQLNEYKIKAKININTENMKFNETKIGAAILGAVNAGLKALKPEEKTEENIEALVNTAANLVAETLQEQFDKEKAESTEKFNALQVEKDALQAKVDKSEAKGSEDKGGDASIGDAAPLSDSAKAMKEFASQLTEGDKIAMGIK